ncbi:hypothetical protein Tco_1069452 [Tanacetum coccineum]|uniref:Uncharacterized protein n=1 Tax=Tanacetum coccineum TaxID=301880 RepID=A0ABQ5HKG4_9ASTR
MPEPIQKPDATKMTIEQFTKHLNKTTSSIFSFTPPTKPTPLKDKSKGKENLYPVTIRAQTQKIAEYEAKRKKMCDEYNHQITHRADQLPITKISYRVNSSKEATMRIIRGNDPLNLTMHEKFRLKTLGLVNGLKYMLWHPMVDGMHRNLIPPPRVKGRKGLVIREPESGIFYYNGNFYLAFQREEEFHLATTAQLIRLYDAIQRGTLEAEELFKKIRLTIEARDNVDHARKIVQDNLDGLGQNM